MLCTKRIDPNGPNIEIEFTYSLEILIGLQTKKKLASNYADNLKQPSLPLFPWLYMLKIYYSEGYIRLFIYSHSSVICFETNVLWNSSWIKSVSLEHGKFQGPKIPLNQSYSKITTSENLLQGSFNKYYLKQKSS